MLAQDAVASQNRWRNPRASVLTSWPRSFLVSAFGRNLTVLRCNNTSIYFQGEETEADLHQTVREARPEEASSSDPEEQAAVAHMEQESDSHADRGWKKCEDNEKRMKRVMANRNSARASYLRRKRRITVMQSRNSDLSQMNHALSEENTKLRLEVQELRKQVHFLQTSPSPEAGGLSNASMSEGGLGGISDLDIVSQMTHPHQPTRSSLFSNAPSSVHQSFPTTNVPNTSMQANNAISLNQIEGFYHQHEEQDVSTLELQEAFLTNQFLARSLGLPPTSLF